MPLNLSKNPKVKYSPSEIKVFKILVGYKKPITTKEVTWDFFDGGEERPYHAEAMVSGYVRSLKKKMFVNKEGIELERIKQSGKLTEWKLKRKVKKRVSRNTEVNSPLNVD